MFGSSSYLVDVGDELSLTGHVHLLVVGPHLTLDGEEEDLQVPLLREPAGDDTGAGQSSDRCTYLSAGMTEQTREVVRYLGGFSTVR